MKKLLFSLTSTLLLSFSILGCLKFHIPIKSDLDTLSTSVNTNELRLEMSLENSTLKAPVHELNLKIKNNGTQEYFVGREYSIERYEEDSWFYVPFKNNTDFQEDAILIKPGKEVILNVDLNLLNSELQNGKYRVIKFLNYTEEEPLFIGCEFIIQ